MIDADIAAASRSGSRRNLYDDNPMVQADRRLITDGPSAERTGRIVLASLIATLGPLSFGYCLGYSSSAVEDFKNETHNGTHLSESQGSWFGAILALGAILGSIIGGWTAEVLGRRGSILVCVIPFEVGWLLIISASSHAMLYSGRVITGIGVGMVSLAVPVYIAEISTASLRGTLGSANQLAVTIGILLSYTVGTFCNWRWLAAIGAIPPALLISLMYFMPETPRWSLSHNRRREALQALLWLRGPEADVEEECYRIEETLDNHEKMSFKEFCSPSVTKPLIISLGLMFFQQFCGINAVLFNCAKIFGDAGFTDGKLVSIAVGAVQVVGTAVACVIMDKAGRRILLLLGVVGMCVSLIALGFYFEVVYIPSTATPTPTGHFEHSVDVEHIKWLSILSVIVFIVFFSLAWGPIPWLVMSEIFPLRARSRASSLSTLFNWLLVFVVTKTFESLVESLTPQGTYWFYAGWCFVGFVFVFILMPETKGKTLEEIELLFDKNKATYQPID